MESTILSTNRTEIVKSFLVFIYSAPETIQGFFFILQLFLFFSFCFSLYILRVLRSLIIIAIFIFFILFHFILFFFFVCSKSFSRATVQARSPCIISVIRSLQHLFDYICRKNRFFKKGHILFILYRTNGTKKIS